MIRFFLILVAALSSASLASAQNLVSPKLLPPAADLRVATGNASFGQNSSASSEQPATHRHWTKGGKIMTFIGIGLMAGGAGALGYGLSSENSYSCNTGGTCVAVDWKITGALWLAGGAALTVVGATRRSSD